MKDRLISPPTAHRSPLSFLISLILLLGFHSNKLDSQILKTNNCLGGLSSYNGAGNCANANLEFVLMVDESFLSQHGGNFAVAKAKAELLFDNMANRFSNKLLTFGRTVNFSRIHFTEDVALDAWNTSTTEAWAVNLRNYWSGPGKRCIKRDGIILLTGQSFGLDGFHSGETICEPGIISSTGSSEVMVVRFQPNNNHRTENTMAHEIGHAMNLGHLNEIITYQGGIPGPSTTCYMACSTPQPPLMCESGGEIEYFSNCDQVCLNYFFSDTKCPCLQTVFPTFASDFTCPDPPTGVLIQFDSDNTNPTRNCSPGLDETTIHITLVNNNQQAIRNLRLFLPNANTDRLDLIPVSCTDSKGRQACFDHVEIVPASREEYRVLKSNHSTPPVFPDDEQVFDLQPGESIMLNAKVRYTYNGTFTNPTDYKFEIFAYTGTSPNINNAFSIYPAFEINATPSKNWSTVIATVGVPVTKAPLLITGKLIVDAGVANYDFNQNKKLLFNANGSGLEIANSTTSLHEVELAGCTQMWEGVTVVSGSNLNVEKSQIRDAQFAVNIKKGATVQVKNSTFINNNFAIHTAADGIGLYNVTLLSNRYGTIGDGLKPGYNGQIPAPTGKGFAGVYIRDNTSGVDIGADPVDNEPNVFINLKHGIITKNTNLTVRNTIFEGMAKVYAGAGYEAYTNSLIAGKAIYAFGGSVEVQGGLISVNPPVVFTNCHTGIEALAAGVNIWECTMSAVSNGIVAKAGLAKPYTIAWNNISASERGISVFYQSGLAGQSSISNNTVLMNGNIDGIGIATGGQEMLPQYGGTLRDNIVTIDEGASGISIGAAQNMTVTGNFVYLAGAGVLYGLKLEGGDGNTLNCNTMTNLGSGENDGLYAVHASRARVVCNTANGTARGLHFEGMLGGKMKADVAANTMKNNGVAGLWLGTDAVIGWQSHRGNEWENAEAFAGVNAYEDSKFIVDADENAKFLPSDWSPDTWFENVADPNLSYQCLPGSSCPVPPEAPDEALDIKIAKGELSGIEHLAANIWLAQRRFYERILEEGNPYPGNPDVAAFISQAQSNGLSNYAAIQTGIRQLGAMSENDRIAAAANLLALNASLTGSAAYQTNEKTVNELLLQTVAIGNISFTPAQQEELENIAAACPLSDGEAVLRARAMLYLGWDTPPHYDDIAICNGGERSFRKPQNSNKSIQASVQVYPNPTHGELTIQYRGLGDSENHFVIFNALGQMIRDIILTPDQDQIRLSLNSLPEGVCWYSVIGRSRISGKLIISR